MFIHINMNNETFKQNIKWFLHNRDAVILFLNTELITI